VEIYFRNSKTLPGENKVAITLFDDGQIMMMLASKDSSIYTTIVIGSESDAEQLALTILEVVDAAKDKNKVERKAKRTKQSDPPKHAE
jgi:hypothetical protein